MKKISVRAALLSTLVVFGALIVLNGLSGIYSLKAANRSTRQVHAVSSQCIALDDAYMDMSRARAMIARVYIEAHESKSSAFDLKTLEKAQSSVRKSIAEFKIFAHAPLIEDENGALRETISNAAAAHTEAVQHSIDALHALDFDRFAAINAHDVQQTGAAYSKVVDSFQEEAKALAQSEADLDNARSESVTRFFIAGIAVAFFLVIATHYGLRALVLQPLTAAADLLDQVALGDLTISIPDGGNHEVGRLFVAMARMRDGLTSTVRHVLHGSSAVNVGAREIAAGNQDLSSRTEEQSAALEETAEGIRELSSTVTRSAENANTARALAEGAADLATRGGGVVRGVVSTMNEINASAARMTDIISTIDGIAFQTNILALNAAVEAARAGEHGRGFAVVAGEVRALAQRSASAAREIRSLIDDSRTKVESGNQLVAQAGATIDETIAAVQKVAGIVNQISTESSAQANSIVEISRAISQMEVVTQHNAALVEQAAAAAASLESQSNQLEEAVSSFVLCAGR